MLERIGEELGVTEMLSHVKGPTDEPLLDETVPALLRRMAAEHPDHDALVFPAEGIRLTYAAFAAAVDQLATGFHGLGLRKGDRVGIWSPNRVEWVLTQFATARLGVILVCINPAYRVHELEHALNAVGCKGLVTARAFKSADYVAMLGELAPELADCAPGVLRAAVLPSLEIVVALGADDPPPGMLAFDALAATPADAALLADIDQTVEPSDVINIQFTSGTTGRPKGASLTHRNIVNNAHFVTARMAFTAQDRLCVPVPFYHCFGMVMGTLGCLTKGATMVVPGEGFDPEATLRAIDAERCTAAYGVPTMFLAQLDHPDFAKFDMSCLRTGIMAGAPCPIEVMRRVQSEMHMTGVTIAYGMTETSPVSFQSNLDDPIEQRVASVGRIHPHVEVKVVDASGATVPRGSPGELLTRGYSVMQGYWGDAEKTAASIDPDGWMHTGDIGVIDADGFCRITGRIKDMILRGGENIYPKEIEDFLFTHPGVQQAEVFGIPDPHYGEVVCAWVIPHAGATLGPDDIRRFCKDRIAHFKVPAHIQIRDDWPMTVTGKPQKFIMRQMMCAELGIEAP